MITGLPKHLHQTSCPAWSGLSRLIHTTLGSRYFLPLPISQVWKLRRRKGQIIFWKVTQLPRWKQGVTEGCSPPSCSHWSGAVHTELNVLLRSGCPLGDLPRGNLSFPSHPQPHLQLFCVLTASSYNLLNCCCQNVFLFIIWPQCQANSVGQTFVSKFKPLILKGFLLSGEIISYFKN